LSHHSIRPYTAELFNIHPGLKELIQTGHSIDAMSSEVFRRVGRGGAGNWYSKKDIEDAGKANTEVGYHRAHEQIVDE
jgi:hypothetical protein